MDKKATHQSVIDLYNSISGGTMKNSGGAVRSTQPERIEAHVHNGDKTHELAEKLRSKLAAKLDPGEMNQMLGTKDVTDVDKKPKQIKNIKKTKTPEETRVENDRMAAQQQVPVSTATMPKQVTAAHLALKLKLAGCGESHDGTKKSKKDYKKVTKDIPRKAVKIASALAVSNKQAAVDWEGVKDVLTHPVAKGIGSGIAGAGIGTLAEKALTGKVRGIGAGVATPAALMSLYGVDPKFREAVKKLFKSKEERPPRQPEDALTSTDPVFGGENPDLPTEESPNPLEAAYPGLGSSAGHLELMRRINPQRFKDIDKSETSLKAKKLLESITNAPESLQQAAGAANEGVGGALAGGLTSLINKGEETLAGVPTQPFELQEATRKRTEGQLADDPWIMLQKLREAGTLTPYQEQELTNLIDEESANRDPWRRFWQGVR